MTDNHTEIKEGSLVRVSLLFVVFVVLLIAKLAGWISINWWLVTLPLWIVPSILLVLGTAAAVLYFLARMLLLVAREVKSAWSNWKRV